MQIEEVQSDLSFSVNVGMWGRQRLVGVVRDRIFFQAATCFPCPTCTQRVGTLKQALASAGIVDYDTRIIESLLFFSFPQPKDCETPTAVVDHLNALFGQQVQLSVVTADGAPIKLPVYRQVFEPNNTAPKFKSRDGQILSVSKDGYRVAWESTTQVAWCPAPTDGLYGGVNCSVDFQIEVPGGQLGVGFLLTPLDWGFYGYLGASATAWSYDPSCGAIVTNTEAVVNSLPTCSNGTITLRMLLADPENCSAQFIVEGVETPPISLPNNSVVSPAACLLSRGQSVKLANFQLV